MAGTNTVFGAWPGVREMLNVQFTVVANVPNANDPERIAL